MSRKPVIPRARANQDVQEAIGYDVNQNTHDAALAFLNDFEQTITHIQNHPATGSPRYSHTLDLPGLRSWSCKRFPYQIFYIERLDHIDVWRVLHEQRNIPAWLLSDGE